jgi:methylaspartate mutase epsilon subunit
VASAAREQTLVVEPRMGFSDLPRMRSGPAATRAATGRIAGTITIDSYTRVGDEAAAERAVRDGVPLNGYPITARGAHTTKSVLHGIRDDTSPVQVRHGWAQPQRILAALVPAGRDATESGPVSYCLPYRRMPLRESAANWGEAVEFPAGMRDAGLDPHLETFGGCMLGQLCPLGQLVAISAGEALFSHRLGLRSISLSYAQQTNVDQDEQAVGALHRLAAELSPDTDRHVVLYTYLGLFPRTAPGALRPLAHSAQLAVRTGGARLIVKSVAEAHRIATITENVEALETAAAAAASTPRPDGRAGAAGNEVDAEAREPVDAVLDLHDDVGSALLLAFERGYLDATGRPRWADVGPIPLGHAVEDGLAPQRRSADLLEALSFVRRRDDDAPLDGDELVPIGRSDARGLSGTPWRSE